MTTRRSFLRRALGSVLAAVAAVYCPGLGEGAVARPPWNPERIVYENILNMKRTLDSFRYRTSVPFSELMRKSGPFNSAPSAETP